MYPGDAAFLDNVAREAADNIRRLRHHPSIALWCGNNESEEAWFHWGWKERLPSVVWEDYEKIFQNILPRAVRDLDPQREYWPSSPHSLETGRPRAENSGDMHYWGIWHGQEPFSEYRNKNHRFFSEFGFQSFPLLETVKTFTAPEDRNITSPVMELHQKHPIGNRLIIQYMLDHYRMPKDFPSLLWLSQVLQAEGMKTAVEYFRSRMPRIMGALYWQINDCWPVASWAGIDGRGIWKALHFYAGRFFSPVLVVPLEENKSLNVYGVSDRREPVDCELSWGIHFYRGGTAATGRRSLTLLPGSSRIIWSKSLPALIGDAKPQEIYFSCRLLQDGKTLSSNVFHFAPLKKTNLPRPRIEAEIEKDNRGLWVVLRSGLLAKNVYLSAPEIRGRFENNFFDLMPGRPVRIRFVAEGHVSPALFKKRLQIISLRDSY
jgi:beta-mannosidase